MSAKSMKLAFAAAALFVGGAMQASAQTAVKFALDWKFEGPSAPYFVAIDKGYYKAEGLDVTVDSGPGSVAGIARVAAGASTASMQSSRPLASSRSAITATRSGHSG